MIQLSVKRRPPSSRDASFVACMQEKSSGHVSVIKGSSAHDKSCINTRRVAMTECCFFYVPACRLLVDRRLMKCLIFSDAVFYFLSSPAAAPGPRRNESEGLLVVGIWPLAIRRQCKFVTNQWNCQPPPRIFFFIPKQWSHSGFIIEHQYIKLEWKCIICPSRNNH